MRRFWTEARCEGGAGTFRILLDGRPVCLPSGAALSVGRAKLAEAIADEWQRAGLERAEISFAEVPLTRLAGTAQERIAPDPGPTAEAVAKYAETDLLCYRADGPEALVRRQARGWQPWLDWAALELDAPLCFTSGVIPIAQPPASLLALRRAVAAHDAGTLAALGIAVPVLGSLVLGLALAAGRLDAETAHALSIIDEEFQEELWGVDAEAAARRQRIGADIVLATRFMELCRS
jgi:chaperone required for assembly of F1-ATPase